MLVEIWVVLMGLLILASAVMVLRVTELVHATVWLAALLFGVAGIFLSLGAEFLATIQVLVYVGAVITLILFTVMLTIPVEYKGGVDEIVVPPGVNIESIQDIHRAVPTFTGAGPYKDLLDTNPRRPQKKPANLYGVALADDDYASDVTPSNKGDTK
ncbi:MAG TPA: NADH-quinone oxidoreductase subunit J [Candidatus Thermoplasmatota archaeon]|nr:NADH-quinone oxidoreductase subunit J [Candidatus Thermoplasmatota archaeon]